MRYLLVLAAVLGIVAVGSANSFAATDIFMQYGNIKGDSLAAEFPNWIQLDSFQFGVEKPVIIGSTSQFQTGAPKFDAITITKPMDISSAPLLNQLLAPTPSQTVKIDLVRTSNLGKLTTYAEYDLTNPIITGYSVSSGGEIPSETLTIQFETITFTFTPQNPDGTLGTPIKSTWDLVYQKPLP